MEEVFKVIVGVIIGILFGGIILGLFAVCKMSSWCSMKEEEYRIKDMSKKGKKCKTKKS